MSFMLANAGVPMIAWQMPAMVMALVPIFLIESAVARRSVSISTPRLFTGVGIANVVSTFVGIPLAWFMMLLLELLTIGGGGVDPVDSPLSVFKAVVLGAAWLSPYSEPLWLLVSIAALVLLIPYFLVSVLAEYLVLRCAWNAQPGSTVARATWRMNLVSYAALAVLVIVWLCWEWMQYQPA